VDEISTAYGVTALMVASIQGHLSVVELLVQSGSDFEIANTFGRTAVDIARARGHIAVVRFLGMEGNWRRRRNYTTMLSSIHGAPTASKAMQAFQCHDVAHVIASYL
jgi:ankyrin repeat protein